MKILVIFTGGTIGSKISEGYISPDEKGGFKLINKYIENTGDRETIFDTMEPYTILSENINGKYISMLLHAVDDATRKGDYDGIIVTHGTDTIQFTAAALGMVFKTTKKPIILVSSNKPIEVEGSNGVDNFIYAVDCIKSVNNIKNKDHSGVYVSYKNDGEQAKLFHACTLLRQDIYSDNLKSLKVENLTPEIDNALKTESLFAKAVNLPEHAPVALIFPYPGMRYPHISPKTKAVLFNSFHSGTIRTNSEQLIQFCEYLKKHNIPAYICGVPEGVAYESMAAYEKLGIKVLPKATDIYWYMKLWLELS